MGSYLQTVTAIQAKKTPQIPYGCLNHINSAHEVILRRYKIVSCLKLLEKKMEEKNNTFE